MNQEAPYRFQRKSEKPRFHLCLYFFLSIPPPCFGKELETPFAILYSQSPLKRRCFLLLVTLRVPNVGGQPCVF